MKKLLIPLIVLVLVLAACGKQSSDQKDSKKKHVHIQWITVRK